MSREVKSKNLEVGQTGCKTSRLRRSSQSLGVTYNITVQDSQQLTLDWFTWGEEKSMRGASVTVGRAAGDWEIKTMLYVSILSDSPELRQVTSWLPLVLPGSGSCSSHIGHIWEDGKIDAFSIFNLQPHLKNRLFMSSFTSKRSAVSLSSSTWCWMRFKAQIYWFKKTHLVNQLHQTALHSSTGGMESFKHGPILQTPSWVHYVIAIT